MKHPKAPEIQECQAFRGAVRAAALSGAFLLASCASRSPDADRERLGALALPAGVRRWDVVALHGEPPEVLRWRSEGIAEEAPYDLCSVGKLFTLAIIAEYCRDGRLSPDADVEALLGRQLRDARLGGEPVRVRHLLTHTSGLAQVEGALRQRTPAGVRYEYSNEAWSILADVAEVVSGEPFDALLARRATAIAQPVETSLPRGAGGLATYADGAQLWGRTVMDGSWIPDPETTTLAMGLPDRDPPLAAGWQAFRAADGAVHRFAQSGSAADAGAEVDWYPRENALVVILADGRYDAEFFREARRVAERRLGIEEPRRMKTPKVATVEVEGAWEAPLTGERVEIVREGANRLAVVGWCGTGALAGPDRRGRRSHTESTQRLRRHGASTFLPEDLAGDAVGRSLASESGERLEVLRDGERVLGLWWRDAYWRAAVAPTSEAKLRSN